eukprot:1326081-Rhodomonas_salina.1
MLQLLLSCGADVNLADKFDRSALWLAVEGGSLGLATELVAAGGKVEQRGKDYHEGWKAKTVLEIAHTSHWLKGQQQLREQIVELLGRERA